MNQSIPLLIAVAVLAVGTFVLRLAGPLLRKRVKLSTRAERLLGVAVIVLFSALIATSALFQGPDFAGFARPIGVAVGGVLAWRKAPFLVVVLAAAITAAGLRLL